MLKFLQDKEIYCITGTITLCFLFWLFPVVDCGDPGTPIHGTQWIGSTSLNSIVKYMCDNGFTLIGDSFRVCQSSGQWSGALPICECELLGLEHYVHSGSLVLWLPREVDWYYYFKLEL